jgi:hypothetical protein
MAHVLRIYVVADIHQRSVGGQAEYYTLHRAHVAVGRAKIGRQGDNRHHDCSQENKPILLMSIPGVNLKSADICPLACFVVEYSLNKEPASAVCRFYG